MLLLVLLCEPPEQPCNGLEFFYLVYLNRKKSQDTKERRPDITEMTLCVLCLNTILACEAFSKMLSADINYSELAR